MAFVTDDKRVKKIIKRFKASAITEEAARAEIKALSPQTDSEGKNPAAFGYLPWEIDEAISPTI